MKASFTDWERYERLVARLLANQLQTDLCVTPNAYVMGRITGIKRQIDVLIDDRHATATSRRLIVDAKKRSRKIDVKEVEAFRGLMEDVGATHGYLVSPLGHTKGAEKRAQEAVKIRILPLDRLEDFDPSTWPLCKNERCERGRIFWDGYPELTLKLQPLFEPGQQPQPAPPPRLLPFVYYVGKCDRCGRFHVRCTTCNDTLALPEDDENDSGHNCSCKPPWFWLASIEEDDDGRKAAELHVFCITGRLETVDRRSL